MKLIEMDVDEFLGIIASSDGNTGLATERINRKLGNKGSDCILEYEVMSRIAEFDVQTADTLTAKFRTLLMVKLYDLITQVQTQVTLTMGDLRPSELAKMHTGLLSSFAQLSAPAAKITFDPEMEIQRLAEEFEIPVEDIRGNLKALENRVKLKVV